MTQKKNTEENNTLTLDLGLNKNHYVNRSISNINVQVYASLFQWCNSVAKDNDKVFICNHDHMLGFFRLLFKNENQSIELRFLKHMNISIYACILLASMNIPNNQTKLDIAPYLTRFKSLLKTYSYHLSFMTTLLHYIDPQLIVAFCYMKNLNPKLFFGEDERSPAYYSLTDRSAHRFFDYVLICNKIGFNFNITMDLPTESTLNILSSLNISEIEEMLASELEAQIKQYSKANNLALSDFIFLSCHLFDSSHAIRTIFRTLTDKNVKIKALKSPQQLKCFKIYKAINSEQTIVKIRKSLSEINEELDSKINKLPNLTAKLENTTVSEFIKLVQDYVATKRISIVSLGRTIFGSASILETLMAQMHYHIRKWENKKLSSIDGINKLQSKLKLLIHTIENDNDTNEALEITSKSIKITSNQLTSDTVFRCIYHF